MNPRQTPHTSLKFPALFSLALGASLFSPDAAACGGFFCSAAQPVNQAAERIIFSQQDGVTTQIIEILYEGPSERFAWVLPVPGDPDVQVSSGLVFQRLQSATNPSYRLNNILTEDCSVNFNGAPGAGGFAASAGTGGASSVGGGSPGPTVTVVSAGSVGPFDYETISVEPADEDPAEVAITWLEDNGYDVGALGADVLRPYLENGLNLLAVRLQKGTDAGAIQPLSITFEGSRPSIPIRPTAVAANDDMGILVWLLGEGRGVPTNYLGLELNEAYINWNNASSNYDQVVTMAANEANGQGFVTEFAGSINGLAQSLWNPTEQLSEDEYSEYVVGYRLRAVSLRFGTYEGFSRVFAQHVQFRDGLTASDFIACADCYLNPEQYPSALGVDYGTAYDAETDPLEETDVLALFSAIDEEVLRPIRDAADLFEDGRYLTRLYTTMSADEMSMDPVFDFNSELPDVSNLHVADRLVGCSGVSGPWTVILPDGREVHGSGPNWPVTGTDAEDMPYNVRLVSFSAQGPGKVVLDNTDLLNSLTEESPVMTSGMGGAGSGSSGGKGSSTGSSLDDMLSEMRSERGGGCSASSLVNRTRLHPLLFLGGVIATGALFRRRRRTSGV